MSKVGLSVSSMMVFCREGGGGGTKPTPNVISTATLCILPEFDDDWMIQMFKLAAYKVATEKVFQSGRRSH